MGKFIDQKGATKETEKQNVSEVGAQINQEIF